MRALVAVAVILVVLAGCGTQSSEPVPTADPDPVSSDEPAAGVDVSGPTDGSLEADLEPPPPAPTPPSADILEPTPALSEGLFYPAEGDRPSDRDNDLLLLSGSPVIASGEPLALDGLLLDLTGAPVAGATIELWQPDVAGVYLHPDDLGAAERDAYFQSYGETATGPDGGWSFRTIVPGPRDDGPRQLHLRVSLQGRELLTTRLYFAGDPALESDPTALDLGDSIVALTLKPEPGVDEVGFAQLSASQTLVVDTMS